MVVGASLYRLMPFCIQRTFVRSNVTNMTVQSNYIHGNCSTRTSTKNTEVKTMMMSSAALSIKTYTALLDYK